MKISPVQLQYYLFTKLHLAPKDAVALNVPPAETQLFNWGGVNLRSGVEFGWGDIPEGQEVNARPFVVKVNLVVDNQIGAPADFLFDVEAVGYFLLIQKIDNEIDAQNMAQINGAALIYGAIRDQLFNLSTRFPKGPLILPTVNFTDLKKDGGSPPVLQKAEA